MDGVAQCLTPIFRHTKQRRAQPSPEVTAKGPLRANHNGELKLFVQTVCRTSALCGRVRISSPQAQQRNNVSAFFLLVRWNKKNFTILAYITSSLIALRKASCPLGSSNSSSRSSSVIGVVKWSDTIRRAIAGLRIGRAHSIKSISIIVDSH